MDHQVEGRISKGLVGRLVWEIRKLAAPLLEPFGPKSKPTCIYEDDLESLKSKLDRIRATLKDSEKLEITDESMKLWLSELREIEYSVEDILEELEFESLRTSKLEEFDANCGRVPECWIRAGKRKRDEISLLFSSPPAKSLGRKIRKIMDMYNEIASDREALRLREGDGMRRPYYSLRPQSTSLTVEDFRDFHGRRNEMDEVICSLLISEAGHGSDFSVIPIVGMGGVGKSTLVQFVYNDEKVRLHFGQRIWVCMSEGADEVNVTRKIREALTMDPSELSLNLMLKDVMNRLSGTRFLLVLDDVGIHEEHWKACWETIQVLLKVGENGSRVILTTRDARVAKMTGAMHSYNLCCLSDPDSWLICQRRAFDSQNPNAYPDLIQIGKKINQKCRGLPLAAKVLGCLLHTRLNEEHWRSVLESDLWSHDELMNEILPVLRLSYDHLPMSLKRCFLYCSLFPKDYIFEKDQMVLLWIAQGFVQSDDRSKLEDIGSKYFDELVDRSFFEHSPINDLSKQRYVMHDLFHELAQFVAGHDCSRTEDHKLCEVHKKTRHSSLVPHEFHLEKNIQFELIDGQDLRTLLLIRRNEHIETLFCVEIPNFLLLQCLRALDLSNTNLEMLPVAIGNLIHLRYLGLKNTKIKRLPESICSLFKLQTLDLNRCRYLEELPLGTKLLSNLQHLKLPLMQYSNIHILSGIGKLTGLQTLSTIIVGDGPECCGIEELRNMVNHRGDLQISGLKNVAVGQDAEGANLKNKKKLRKLILQWFSFNSSSPGLESVTEVFERLQPHTNLEVLVVRGYRGIKFPSWIGDPSFSKLVTVKLTECGKCKELPPLGQLPSLRHLKIRLVDGVKRVGSEFCGTGNVKGFPMLETLEFMKIYEWEEWCGVEDGDFPRLRNLTISGCQKLKGLPQLNSLTRLGIHSCEQLHNLPSLSSLQTLKMEGFQNLGYLPQLPPLPVLEVLEIGCCKQLSSVGNLKHLSSLRHFKVTNCPILNFSRDEQLPSALKDS